MSGSIISTHHTTFMKKYRFQTGYFPITLVIIKGHTWKLFDNTINNVKNKGNWGDKYSLT